ncbi:MAG: hypothetical protein JST42_01175 [Bacteroidetes bacterium]|nr:hypothetical protein [Bacteroidota bacterium]
MRKITSGVYRVLGAVYVLAFALLLYTFFLEKQPFYMYFAVAGIEIVLAVFTWACYNFVDIYLLDKEELELWHWGKVVEISRIVRVRKLPVYARTSSQQFTVASIRYIDAAANKGLKFFIIPMLSWYYIEKLKAEKESELKVGH